MFYTFDLDFFEKRKIALSEEYKRVVADIKQRQEYMLKLQGMYAEVEESIKLINSNKEEAAVDEAKESD